MARKRTKSIDAVPEEVIVAESPVPPPDVPDEPPIPPPTSKIHFFRIDRPGTYRRASGGSVTVSQAGTIVRGDSEDDLSGPYITHAGSIPAPDKPERS